MSLVAILGAGEIGGAAARALALRARVDVVRLIDEKPGVAAGKALDLRQSGPINGSDTRIEGAADVAAAAGAAAVVLADAMSSDQQGAEWSGEAGLALVRRLSRLGCLDESTVICAGAGQLKLMQQAFDELGLSRRRMIGSAPEAFAATAKALVAIEAQTTPAEVALTVIGDPPHRFVVPWTDASIGGHAVAALLIASQLHLLERRLTGLWPPGPNALGTAAARFSEAIASGSRRLFSAFVSLDRDNGTPAPVCAWPVSIDPSGVWRVTSPSLTPRDRSVIEAVLSGES
jgi:malate dehydrogenase